MNRGARSMFCEEVCSICGPKHVSFSGFARAKHGSSVRTGHRALHGGNSATTKKAVTGHGNNATKRGELPRRSEEAAADLRVDEVGVARPPDQRHGDLALGLRSARWFGLPRPLCIAAGALLLPTSGAPSRRCCRLSLPTVLLRPA